jgi:hypothetical protein
VSRIGETPAAADRHEPRVTLLREDHAVRPSAGIATVGTIRGPPSAGVAERGAAGRAIGLEHDAGGDRA